MSGDAEDKYSSCLPCFLFSGKCTLIKSVRPPPFASALKYRFLECEFALSFEILFFLLRASNGLFFLALLRVQSVAYFFFFFPFDNAATTPLSQHDRRSLVGRQARNAKQTRDHTHTQKKGGSEERLPEQARHAASGQSPNRLISAFISGLLFHHPPPPPPPPRIARASSLLLSFVVYLRPPRS